MELKFYFEFHWNSRFLMSLKNLSENHIKKKLFLNHIKKNFFLKKIGLILFFGISLNIGTNFIKYIKI